MSGQMILDPAWEDDPLPQPYRFLVKLVNQIVSDSLEEVQLREMERSKSKAFQPSQSPNCIPLGTAFVSGVTAVQVCGSSAYVGRHDGVVDVYDIDNNYSRLLSTPPILTGGITMLSVEHRSVDQLPILALAGPDPNVGIVVVTLPGHPHVYDVHGALEAADTACAMSVVARFCPPEAWPPLHIHVAPEGQFIGVVVGRPSKVLVYRTTVPLVPPPPTPPTGSLTGTGKRVSNLAVRPQSHTSFLPPINPQADTIGKQPELHPVTMTPIVTAECPPVAPPTKSVPNENGGDSTLTPFPIIHFWAHAAAEVAFPLPGTGKLPRETHTLVVAWQGLNVFTTYGLVQYNPYLKLLQPTPRPPSTAPKEAEEVPTLPTRGKKAAKSVPSTPSFNLRDVATPPPPPPSSASGSKGLDHLVPTLVNCSTIDSTAELYAVGCSDGVIVVWGTSLGVPKHILHDRRRVSRHVKQPLVCAAVDFFQKDFLVCAMSIPFVDHSDFITVYDLHSGACLSYIDSINHLLFLRCVPMVPFGIILQCGDPYFRLIDLKTGAFLGNMPMPTGATRLWGNTSDPNTELLPPALRMQWRASNNNSIGTLTPSTLRLPSPIVPTTAVLDMPLCYLQQLLTMQNCIQFSSESLTVVGTMGSEAHGGGYRILLQPFTSTGIVCNLYELFGRLSRGRPSALIYSTVLATTHADRLHNYDLLSAALGGPLSTIAPTIRRKGRATDLDPRERRARANANRGSRSVAFAATLTEELPLLTAANLQHLTPKAATPMAASPGSRLKQIQKQREAGRYDREQRLTVRWQEMSSHALPLK